VAKFDPSTTTCLGAFLATSQVNHSLATPSVIGRPYTSKVFRAVFFDFGGVVTSSPFEAISHFERSNGAPPGFVAEVNMRNPSENAWAKIERNEISIHEFDLLFRQETRELGVELSGAELLPLLTGAIRQEMVTAIEQLRSCDLILACLTNNVLTSNSSPRLAELLTKFDIVVESSKVKVRKPERRFYEIACELAQVEPSECAFLDDLGINLKTARQMGMATIKVTSAEQALQELSELLGVELI
jgi:putative hydrolase of the HAD superfamily